MPTFFSNWRAKFPWFFDVLRSLRITTRTAERMLLTQLAPDQTAETRPMMPTARQLPNAWSTTAVNCSPRSPWPDTDAVMASFT